MSAQYPKSAVWGNWNADCHAALQAMWAQYDHVVPFTQGGDTHIDTLIDTCAPCNFSRMEHSLEALGLIESPQLRTSQVALGWVGTVSEE